MNPSLEELAVILAEPMGKALDQPFRDQMIMKIIWWRAELLRRAISKAENDSELQLFTEYITIPLIRDNCGQPQCGLKTKIKIPAAIPGRGNLYSYVGDSARSVSWTKLDPGQGHHFSGNKLLSRYPAYTIEGPYIKVLNTTDPLSVTIAGVFSDVKGLMTCEDENPDICDWHSLPFKCDLHIIQQIMQSIHTIDLKVQPLTPEPNPQINLNDDEQRAG